MLKSMYVPAFFKNNNSWLPTKYPLWSFWKFHHQNGKGCELSTCNRVQSRYWSEKSKGVGSTGQ